MVTQDDSEEPVELTLTLTPQTIALLDQLSGPEGLHPEHTRESLAVAWLGRWSRRGLKQLDYYDRFGSGTEPLTLTVNRPLWRILRDYGTSRRWWPEETASAVLNDSGGRMTPETTCDTLK